MLGIGLLSHKSPLNLFLATVGDLIAPDQKLLNPMGRMYGQPAHRVVKPVHGFIPGTHRDTAAAAAGPFSFIHSPEYDALFGVNPPFAEPGVIVDRIGYFSRWVHPWELHPKDNIWHSFHRPYKNHAYRKDTDLSGCKGKSVVTAFSRMLLPNSGDSTLPVRQNSPTPASSAMGTIFNSGSPPPLVSRYMAS